MEGELFPFTVIQIFEPRYLCIPVWEKKLYYVLFKAHNTNTMSQEQINKQKDTFVNHMNRMLTEIQTNFDKLRTQLDKSEENLRDYVQTMKSDALRKFELALPQMSCITKKHSINCSIDDDDSSVPFVDIQIEDNDSQINAILRKTGIENTIELRWKLNSLGMDNICEIETNKFSIVDSSCIGKKRDRTVYRVNDAYREHSTPSKYRSLSVSPRNTGTFGSQILSSQCSSHSSARDKVTQSQLL